MKVNSFGFTYKLLTMPLQKNIQSNTVNIHNDFSEGCFANKYTP